MECYLCEEQKTIFCTSCCYRTCCKKCANDFGLVSECQCYNKVDSLLKCHQKPDNKLEKCQESLDQCRQKWTDWIKSIQDAQWKLDIPLNEYMRAFKKAEELYQDRLDAIKELNSNGYYIAQDILLFEFEIPKHNLIRLENGKKVVVSKKFEEFLEKYIGKPWTWMELSSNPNITMEIVEKYPDKPWNWGGLSRNPNITIEFIEKYPDKPWDWYGLSYNPTITMEIVEKYPNKPWNWGLIFF